MKYFRNQETAEDWYRRLCNWNASRKSFLRWSTFQLAKTYAKEDCKTSSVNMKIYDIHFLEKYQQILDAIIEVNGIISTQYDEKNAMNWAEWCVVTNIEPIAAEYSLHDSEFLLSVVRENNRHENFLYF